MMDQVTAFEHLRLIGRSESRDVSLLIAKIFILYQISWILRGVIFGRKSDSESLERDHLKIKK